MRLKNFLLISILVLLIFNLTIGCQKKSATDADKSTGQQEKKMDPNVSILVDERGLDEYAEAVKIFEEKYGGKVEHTIVPLGDAYQNKVVTAINAGTPFDVIRWSDFNMPTWAIKGILQPIDNYFNMDDPVWEKYMSATQSFKYMGNLYGVSAYAETIPIFYNKTMFENNGLKTPYEHYKEGTWNWETFRKSGIALTQDLDKDGAIDQWGFSLNANTMAVCFVLGNGGNTIAIEDNGIIKLKLDDPRVLEALQFYQDGIVKDKYIMPDPKFKNLFVEGRLAMITAYDAPAVREFLPNMKDEWDIAPFPKGPMNDKGVYPGGGGFWGISNGANNPEGAAMLIYLRQKAWQEQEDDLLTKYFKPEQIVMLKELRSNVVISKSNGIGELNKKMNQLWNDLRNNIPVYTAIERYTPAFQEEIDLTMDSKK